MRAVLAALLVSCAPPAMTMTAEHPANPDAAAGRLAGPPAALRRGGADLSKPAPPAGGEVLHEHGAAAGSHAPAKPTTSPAAEKPGPAKSADKPRKQNRPAASKPVPGSADKPQKPPPAHQGHEGHH